MTNTANQNAMAPIMQHSMMMHQPIQQPAPRSLPPDDEDELKAYANTLFDHRWMIMWIVLAATLIGVAYAFMAKPEYQASMMIHVEENSPNASKNILGDMASLFDTKAEVTAEMELLHSRLVISRAVDNMRLYIDAHPKYFPLIGAVLARQNRQLSSPGIFGIGGYAWGAEKISVPVFNVPDILQNRDFVIKAEGNGQYLLTEKTQNIFLKGKVGIALNAVTDRGNIELMVDQLAAAPGAEFSLRRTSRLTAIEEVQKAMTVTEQGKQSGIVHVTLQGQNPQLTTYILSEIGREYTRQNLGRKTEEAAKSLAFLNTQLPELKQQLEQSEAKYNQFRNAHGTIDLGEEARLSLQQSAAAKTRRIELQQKRTELLSRFTDEHPIVQGVNSQLRDIDNEIREVAGHIKTLPTLEQDVVRLNRDVKVNTDLYTALSNTAQQLRLITVGKVSNVRMIDSPMVPEEPLKPNRPLVIALALLTGLMLGVMTAFIKKTFKSGIENPEHIEKMLGSRVVYATIPHSDKQTQMLKHPSKSNPMRVLAQAAPEDVAIESLRFFRTAMQFAMPKFKNNIVLITGPTPGLGKSFVSVNFAAVLAETGKKVLLIDADFRNGHLHQSFGMERQGGLSEAITGAKPLEQSIRRGVLENLDFIPTGLLPRNPSKFLLHTDFGALLQTVSSKYDVVLIDAAPVLAVSDTLVIGSHAGAVFILTRAGITTEAEINESIKRLNHAGIAPAGLLFNDLTLRPGVYGYGYGYGNENISQLEYS